MAAYFGIDDPDVGLKLHAFVGGTPGYRDLLGNASPQTVDELDHLLLTTVLNPSHALFSEAGYLLREDPRVVDRSLYHSIVASIAAGAGTPARIATAIGRPERSLGHALDVLLTAGFVVRDEDVLLQRRAVLSLADPIVRFHEVVIAPRLAAFEDRDAANAWQHAAQSVNSQILGPHFEFIAREWVRRFASPATLGGTVDVVGRTVVNDSHERSRIELDVVALAPGQRPQGKQVTVLAIGEAKFSRSPRGMRDLARLDRAKALLMSRGIVAGPARLLLFGRSGFDADLESAATARGDVELVDLARLWVGA